MKHFISSGHVNINPHLLEEVLFDTPVCTGKKELRICKYATDCNKKCYESVGRTCNVYRFYDLNKSKCDKFGVLK